MRHNFLNLEVWRRSRILVKEIYFASQNFPSEEKFGLTSQLRRSAVSVPSNISEGCGRGTIPQLKKFLDIAIGSLCELETQVYLSFDLGYLKSDFLILNSLNNSSNPHSATNTKRSQTSIQIPSFQLIQ